MSHWTKGKFRQREPPPAVFVQGSPTTSKVSLSGNVGVVGGPGSGSGSGGGAGGSRGGGGVLSPVMPTLQRTASRLRQEVAGNTAPPRTPSSGGVVSEKGGGVGSSGGAGGSGSPSKAAAAATSGASTNNAFSLALPLSLGRPSSSSRATDRADSLWAEMQATLEEVELSASEGTRVFGPDHDGKLAELRQAQIALAQAWARSEADDAIETTLSSAAAAATAAETAKTGTTAGAGTAPGTATGAAPGTAEGEQLHATMSNLARTTTAGTTPSGARDDVSGTAGADGSTAGTATASAAAAARMEAEETQVDILLARKRREANDRYFQRVSRGVLDVVAKLDDVAVAMRAVEQESKEMFGDNGVEEEDEGEGEA
ncbi:hypothetical protein CMQ_4325 [Grosmannia clavigera kw1407]|uniref:Uncharacterized protein n=1 Tax=Grosmannia clavigera (strain kw1407 / UAMH 11150) TaxID=655863 RepID=F0XV15_GROCL|nr:uncharacterized protein CMQ_4325 [Grosmannia clavigera kw1407]EFW98473.1 hypothetical protein CMQ_4325 [Grosmannia clavigera kw1407]